METLWIQRHYLSDTSAYDIIYGVNALETGSDVAYLGVCSLKTCIGWQLSRCIDNYRGGRGSIFVKKTSALCPVPHYYTL